MKKIWLIVGMMVLLAGCSSVETFETLGDISHISATEPAQRKVMLTLPADAALDAAIQDPGASMYACDGYTMVLQMFDAGDMEATIRALSGFSPKDLTVMESVCGDHIRYDWVWTAAAEEGDLVCRGTVLDDGNYHYTLCVMAQAATAGELTQAWNDLFASFCLAT